MSIIVNNPSSPSMNLEAYNNILNNDSKKSASPLQASKVVKGDQVVLSSEARDIYKTKKLLEEYPVVREEKVAEIKKQIGLETYEFNGNKVAFNMIKESLLFDQTL